MTKTIIQNKLFQIFMMLFAMSMIVATQGWAQSFSCARAKIPSEMAICNNELLLIKDEKIGQMVGEALASATTQQETMQITTEHAKWLSQRNTCTNDFGCLQKKYDQRIKTINSKGLLPKS